MSEAPTEAFGPYLVYEQLGIGGMAQVHRAEIAGVEGFHRPVALKRMLPHVASNLDMVKAFVREAHLASHLRHANVAQTYELGKVDDTYFIAMELVPGRNLREILRQCGVTTGPMPVSVALNILNQICDALDYAHNLCDDSGRPLGIIHRDVSPSNIIVSEGGVVKLIDFGIAKVSAAGMQTMSGTIKGKFGYMAPEYIAGSIDARADLFALGVIAHELLTNRPLFSSGDDMDTLQRVRKMEILPPSQKNPQVPVEVDDIVMTALSRDPDRRWQHATALRTAMTTVTQRLGLSLSNAQANEWIDWAFDQTKPRGVALRTIVVDDDPSISISEGTVTLGPNVTGAAPSSSQNMTLMVTGAVPDPPTATPVGTPSAMTAQRSVAPGPPERFDPSGEYQAAVAAFERHDALVPSTGRLSDVVLPNIPRTSTPNIPRTPTPNIPRTATPRSVDPPLRSSASNMMTLAGTAPPQRTSAPQARVTPPSSIPPPMAPQIADRPSQKILQRNNTPTIDPPFVHSNPKIILPFIPPADVPAPAKSGGSGLTVVLVLLVAAAVAAAVYFVLPLLT